MINQQVNLIKFDDLITNHLNNMLPQKQFPFKVDCTKNGVFITKNKNSINNGVSSNNNQKKNQQEKQFFLYINPKFIKKNHHIKSHVEYQIIIIKLNNNSLISKENQNLQQPVRQRQIQYVLKIPIQFFNDNSSTINYQSLQSIKIQFTLNPHDSTFFLAYISQQTSAQRNDKVFISMIQLNTFLQKRQEEKHKKVLFYKLNLKHQPVCKADWHPFSPAGLCILYQEQQLQVFNFIDQPQQSQISLNLKYLISSFNFNFNSNKNKKLQINDFTFSQNAKSLQDYFTIYLSSKDGDIFVAYPFVVDKTVISQKHYIQLQTINQKKNLNQNQHLLQLSNLLEKLTLIKVQLPHNGFQYIYPSNFNLGSKTIKFKSIVQYLEFSTQSSIKQKKPETTQTISVQNIDDRKLLIQAGYNKRQNCHYLKFSLLSQIFNNEVKSNYYPIVVYHTKSFKQTKNIETDNKLNKIILLNHLKDAIDNDFKSHLMIFDGERCQKLEIGNMIRAIKQNDLDLLQNTSLIQDIGIFRIGFQENAEPNQIQALAYQNEDILMITRNDKLKFHYLRLKSLIMSKNLKQLSQKFGQIFKQIQQKRQKQKLKMMEANKQLLESTQKQDKQRKQLNDIYEQKTYKLLTTKMKQFIIGIQSRVDSQMNLIQAQYRQLKKAMQVYNVRLSQKKKMQSLVQQIRLNNQKIKQLLENKQSKNNNQKVSSSKNGRTKNSKIQQVKQNIQKIKKLLYAVNTNQRLNQINNIYNKEKYIKTADNILNTLGNMKEQLLSDSKE